MVSVVKGPVRAAVVVPAKIHSAVGASVTPLSAVVSCPLPTEDSRRNGSLAGGGSTVPDRGEMEKGRRRPSSSRAYSARHRRERLTADTRKADERRRRKVQDDSRQ